MVLTRNEKVNPVIPCVWATWDDMLYKEPAPTAFKSESEQNRMKKSETSRRESETVTATELSMHEKSSKNDSQSQHTAKERKRPNKVTKLLVSASTQTRHDCRSTEYLPDIKSGVTLGLISGCKPLSAWMACNVLENWCPAGCNGSECSVWKHQLRFSELGPSLKVHPAGMT